MKPQFNESLKWKPINHENLNKYYEISENGIVRRFKKINREFDKNKLMYGTLENTGYFSIKLINNNKRKKYLIHRLVNYTFNNYDEKNGKNITNHIDGCKTNNNFSNLEWVTRQENNNHAFKNNLYKDRRIHYIPDEIVLKIRDLYKENKNMSKIWKVYDQSYRYIQIYNICKEKTYRHLLKKEDQT